MGANRDRVLEIRRLQCRLEDAVRERDHWKANHDSQVERARILMERPDLPIERVNAYKAWTVAAADAELGRMVRAIYERDGVSGVIAGLERATVEHFMEHAKHPTIDEAVRKALEGK